MTYQTFSGTYETLNGGFVDFEFPAISLEAAKADLNAAYGEGRVFGVRIK